jgi:hypothetical protein
MPKQHPASGLIDELIREVGDVYKLADSLDVTHQAVYAWKRSYVPLERAARIEELYGLRAEALVKPTVAKVLERMAREIAAAEAGR